MSKEKFDTLFTQIVELYKDSEKVYLREDSENIYRGRQHSVASMLEDLFAGFIYRYLSEKYPGIPFCCMIDYRIVVKGQVMYPDIAIIVEYPDPVMVSYIDLKTDFGYKRDYYNQFPYLRDKIELLRTEKNTGTNNNNGKLVAVASSLKMRTVVISEENTGINNLNTFRESNANHPDHLDLYFLSKGRHPNTKEIESIVIKYDEVQRFLQDVCTDFEQNASFLNRLNVKTY